MSPWVKLAWLLVLISASAAFGIYGTWCAWGWFLVPLGLPPITLAHAAGLCVIKVAMDRTPPQPTDEDRERAKGMTPWKAMERPIFSALFLFGAAYLAHLAMQ